MLQVDVIETQFSILMKKISDSEDYETVQQTCPVVRHIEAVFSCMPWTLDALSFNTSKLH